jgi:hypothetical protein
MWPGRPFSAVTSQALEAIYDSLRVDGLPRVIFGVSKEVEKPLRGKMSPVLRHRFKRRGKMALKMALQQLRREDESTSLSPSFLFLFKWRAIVNEFRIPV